jgi:hypothetical protein
VAEIAAEACYPFFPDRHEQEQGMSDQSFVLAYVQACTGGKLPFSECGPMWHLLVIAVFLALAVLTLLVLRIRARAQPL